MYPNVRIDAISYVLPDICVTSSSLEEQISSTMNRLGIPPGILENLSGIRERYFWEPGVTASEAATKAATKLLEETNVNPSEIGCIISTSVSKDYMEPSVACLVHGNLALSPNCRNFDIGNACLGFIDGMLTIAMMIEAGIIKYGLVVDGESAREPIEATLSLLGSENVTMEVFRESFATLTLGSGAVAMLLAHKDVSSSTHKINGTISLADTKNNRLSIGHHSYIGQTDAQELLIAGVELAKVGWELAEESLEKWSDDSIDVYIPHQVSLRHIKALGKALSLNRDKMYLTVETLGNIGPASVPITLQMASDAGRLEPNCHVAILGIGSGLNCTGMSLTW